MKYLFVILFITFAFSSCTKDCKECKTVTTDAQGNVVQTSSSNEYCDEDLEKKENEEPVVVGDNTTKWVCE
ncbi:MAG: hypothetical protein HPY79_06770 [Bacteroidales bacterium]|nr:hypothetical protein [Bacteroidales bacterium]